MFLKFKLSSNNFNLLVNKSMICKNIYKKIIVFQGMLNHEEEKNISCVFLKTKYQNNLRYKFTISNIKYKRIKIV